MSLARGASLRDAGWWPRGTFRSRGGRSAPAWKPLWGFATLRLLEVPPWPRSQAYSPITSRFQVRSVDRLFLAGVRAAVDVRGAGDPVPAGSAGSRSRRRRCWGRSAVTTSTRSTTSSPTNEIPTVRFVKGDVKEEIAREHLQAAEREGRYGVVMVGIAQEKTWAWRGWRDGGPDGHPHFVYRRQSIFPNNYYFYIRDPGLGTDVHQDRRLRAVPGVDLPQRERVGQAAGRPAQGIAFAALDNGFCVVRGPERARRDLRQPVRRGRPSRSSSAGRRALPVAVHRARTAAAATAMTSRSGSWRSPTPACSTGRPPAAPGLSRRSPTSSRSAAPTRPRSSSAAASPPHPGPVSHQDLQPRRRGRDPDPLPRLEGQAVLQRRPRAADRDDDQRHPRLRCRPAPHRRELGRADRRSAIRSTSGSSTHQLDACACAPDATPLTRVVLPSIHRWPTRPRTAVRRAPHDGAARLPVLLPAPVRRADEPHTARADRRADPRLQRAADDLRPAAPTPQRVHPAGSPAPSATSSPARDADWPSSSPRPTRGSSTPPSPNSTPHSPTEIATRSPLATLLARVRTRDRRQNQTGRYRGLKR